MKRVGWIIGLSLALAGLSAVLLWSEAKPRVADPGHGHEDPPTRVVETPRSSHRADSPRLDAAVRETSPNAPAPSADERARVRAKILAASRAAEALEARRPPATEAEPEPERPPGNLTKHVEGHDQLLRELNHDFMPLADECIEQAVARDPKLDGMLSIELEIVVDEDLGAVVDTVSFSEQNEIEQPELQTCIRESLLSMLLPAGEPSQRTQLMLTLPIELDEER